MNELFKKYKEFTEYNKKLKPSVQVIKMPEKQNSFQYVGAQLCDGKIFGVINSAETLLVYDINKAKFSFIGKFPSKDFKWTGGCVYNGIFYMFPRTEQALLSYDIEKQTFSEIEGNVLFNDEHHYGGVCTKDGVIYQPPRNSDHILKWSIANKSNSKIYIDKGRAFRYCGSVIHPNGNVYFIPESNNRIIKMNIKTESIEYIGEYIDGYAFDCNILPDGNIYGFRTENGILKIDIENDEAYIIHEDLYVGSYGTKLGVNGKIYSLPGYTGNVWEYDYRNDEIKKISSIEKFNNVQYAGGAVDKFGNIYAVPVFANNILKISFQKKCIDNDIWDNFFKDFY